jgi:hypothetical protein
LTTEEEEQLMEEIEDQLEQPEEELHLMRAHNKDLLSLLPELSLPR